MEQISKKHLMLSIMVRYIKKIFCFWMCCFFMFGPVMADWNMVVENEDAIYYIFPKKILIRGQIRKVWELQDLKKITWKGEKSFRYLSEYHCRKNYWRILHYTGHSKHMGLGQILSAKRDGDWYIVPPATPRMRVFKGVCKL